MTHVEENLGEQRLPESPTVNLEVPEPSRQVDAEEQVFWKSMFGMLVFAVAMFFAMNPLFRDFFVNKYEKGAVETLRNIGSSQLSYQGTNNEKFYGSFTALQADGYVGSNETLTTLIDGYEVQWQVTNPLTHYGGMLGGGIGNNRFTVIARPTKSIPSNLRTFAVSEDQVVRAYNPTNGNAEPSLSSWDPVL